jgi:hypothetical protein
MPRLARRTLNFLTALSLLLCVITAALWARSLGGSDWVEAISKTNYRGLASGRGRIAYLAWDHQPGTPGVPCWPTWHPLGLHCTLHSPDSALTLLSGNHSFAPVTPRSADGTFVVSATGPLKDLRGFICPYWAILAAFAGLPMWRFRQRPATKLPAGVCSCCAYDLRATPDRCPECGTETVAR